MRALRIFTFLLLWQSYSSANDLPISSNDNIPIWHNLKIEPEQKFLFVAFEEAEFIREQSGQWLPLRLLPIESRENSSAKIVWAVKAEKYDTEKNICPISVVVGNRTTKQREVINTWWTPAVRDPKVVTTVEYVPSGVMISFKLRDAGPVRRLWIQAFESREAAMEQVSISRSSPMWAWHISNWDLFQDFGGYLN